jgi:hypothetical protein
MISKSSEGGGSLPIVDYIGFMPIDLGAVNFDALPLPDISSEVRVPLCLPPVQARRPASSTDSPSMRRHDHTPLLRFLMLVTAGSAEGR